VRSESVPRASRVGEYDVKASATACINDEDLKAALCHHVMIYTTMQANYSFHVCQTSKAKVTLDQEPATVMLSLSLNTTPLSGHLAVHESVQPHGKKVVSEAYNAIVDMSARLGIATGAWDYSFPNVPPGTAWARARLGTARRGTGTVGTAARRAVPDSAAVPNARPRHGPIST
jgi:hypothetical protein